MKRISLKQNIRGLGILVIFALLFTGCDKWIDTDINIDPDSPVDVPMDLIIPSIQANMGYDLGGNTVVRTTNIWMQYFDGVERQSYAEAIYTLTPADVNNLWNSLYATEMMDVVTLINKAGEQNSPHYAGVGKVCLANLLGVTSDLYGDIPYTEAFKAQESLDNLQPNFDSQQDIYATIQTLLTEAIADLAATENDIALSGDMIYGNDLTLWTKAAYALKARYALNLSKKNGNAAYTEALGYLANGFESGDEDFQFAFGTTESEASPLYQFMSQRGDIRMGATLVDALKATGDPRLPFYAAPDGSGDYVGSAPGSENTLASNPGDYIAGISASSVFISYAEQKFMEAECEMKAGSADNALAAYKAAVEASLIRVTGATDTTWMDANINVETSATINLEKIMFQKYLAQFGTLQAYNDWRRVGIPSLNPSEGATGQIPRRFPYPQEEQTYNANCPSGVTINDRVWWDE